MYVVRIDSPILWAKEKSYEEFKLKFTFFDKNGNEQVFEFPIEFIAGHVRINLQNPILWWPKGYGEPHLYKVRCELIYDGEVLDAKINNIGVRTVPLERTETAEEDGTFRFIINGVPLRLRGSNWVPLDAFHSRDKERLLPVLKLFDDLGCNIIRCWGGGVYEPDEFFNFCDEHGITVWQDFAMACARYLKTKNFRRKYLKRQRRS